MDKICIVGASEPMSTMIIDNLESKLLYPEIIIINNLNKELLIPFLNNKFKIIIVDKIDEKYSKLPLVIGVNKPNNKIAVIKLVESWKDNFISLINNSSEISSTAIIEKGVVINSLVSIAAYSTIQEFTTINRNVSVGHHTTIGAFSTINPGANIAGFVKIGEGTSVGMGANIIDRVTIGKNTIIGAGSLVTKDIPDGVIAFGNPCKIIRENEI